MAPTVVTMTSRTSRRLNRSVTKRLGVIALLALILVSAPAGLLIRNLFGEPYPWLFQPSFGYVMGADGHIEVDTPRVVAVTTDGQLMEVSISDVVPQLRTNTVLFFRNNFQRPEVTEAGETADMMALRLAQRFPDRQFLEVRIEWIEDRIDIHTGDRASGLLKAESVIVLPPLSEARR